MNKVQSILENAYDAEIANKIIDSYREIESNFFLEKWKPSELDAGHFVEAVRRLIEKELLGSYTPFSSKLSNFSDAVLKQYEQNQGHESFRLLIPRVLKSVYNIRNKRGVGHIKDISPNEMDSTLILYNVKWVLSEIIRLKSNLSIEETQKLIDEIVERKIDIIWKENDFRRILDQKISAKDQVLILLYDNSPQNIESLRSTIEYKNKSNFKTLIKKLHSSREIEFKSNGECLISPKGIINAEKRIYAIKNKKEKLSRQVRIPTPATCDSETVITVLKNT